MPRKRTLVIGKSSRLISGKKFWFGGSAFSKRDVLKHKKIWTREGYGNVRIIKRKGRKYGGPYWEYWIRPKDEAARKFFIKIQRKRK